MFAFLKGIKYDQLLTNVKDYHIPVALLVFGVTTVYHFHAGKDLGSNYTNSLYAFYGFLAGHKISQQFGDNKENGNNGAGAPTGQ